MRRFHLMEIAEQRWCPRAVRDGVTDYLQFVIDRGRPYAPAVPLLVEAVGIPDTVRTVPAAGASSPVAPAQVIDLGAGAGGPWGSLAAELAAAGRPVRVRLTDLHPNLDAFARISERTEGVVTGESRSIRAEAVPCDLGGFRTIFSAFHHFRPGEARRVLADAADRETGIGIFEATARTPAALLFMLLTPLLVLLATPFLRPFRWSRLFWTYLVPAIPLAVFFDGIVSCLRTYTPEELERLAEGVGPEGYRWRAGNAGAGPIPVTYLVGYPLEEEGGS